MDVVTLMKILADKTRLLCLKQISLRGEVSVSVLCSRLELSQPKVSRHLAQLRHCGILLDRREGQSVYYGLHPALPTWAQKLIQSSVELFDEPATHHVRQSDDELCLL